MKVSIHNKKLRAALEDEREAKRQYGATMASKMVLRMATLDAAISLADFWPPFTRPERCHELQGARIGTFSMDLKQPFRLIFRPSKEAPVGASVDEKTRWENIDEIDVVGIEDTHG